MSFILSCNGSGCFLTLIFFSLVLISSVLVFSLILLLGIIFAKTAILFLINYLDKDYFNKNRSLHSLVIKLVFRETWVLFKQKIQGYFAKDLGYFTKYLGCFTKYLGLFTDNKKYIFENIICIIHGYQHTPADAWALKRRLNNYYVSQDARTSQAKASQYPQANYKIILINIPDTEQSIVAQAQLVAKALENYQGKLHLIGHSMGGLVAAYFAENLDITKATKTVITLGTPWYGTKIAKLTSTESGQQIIYQNHFLQQLRTQLSKANSPIYYTVASTMDELLWPWHSAVLKAEPCKEQLILTNLAHQMFWDDPVVFEFIVTKLAINS